MIPKMKSLKLFAVFSILSLILYQVKGFRMDINDSVKALDVSVKRPDIKKGNIDSVPNFQSVKGKIPRKCPPGRELVATSDGKSPRCRILNKFQ